MDKQRSIIRLLALAARRQMTIFNRHLTEYGIGGGSYVFLVMIVENPGIIQTDLSRRICLDKATAGKALRQLEVSGLITRTPCAEDRRKCILAVTEAGMVCYQKIMDFSTRYRDVVFAELSEVEQTQLEQLLQKHVAAQLKF